MIKKFRIIKNANDNGFFSNFIGALKEIKNAELKGEIPVVAWGKSSLYYERSYGENVWDYYFHPVSGFKSEDIKFYHFKKRVTGAGWFDFILDPGKGLRQTIHRCWNDYIVVNQSILEKVEDFYKRNMQGFSVLGVHIRSTDRKLDSWVISEGAGFLGIVPYISYIKKYIERNKTERIFVSSDEQEIVDRIAAEFANLVIYYDAERSTTGCSIHSDTINFKSPYKKGEDVLIEALLLSKCDFLIRGTSNVSSMSLSINLDLNFWDLNAIINKCQLESWLGTSYSLP